MIDPSPVPPPPGTGAHLQVNSPLAPQALARLLHTATQPAPQTVLDIGCGWGEVLIQALRAQPDATGHGLDVHEPDITRALDLAARGQVQDRVTFSVADASDHPEGADLIINLGAYHALGDPATALATLHTRTNPGGRVLFGLEYWRTQPTSAELAHMWPGASESDCLYLPELAALIQGAGWRILDWHDSTQPELDAYEVNLWREREEWLLEHPSHPVRTELDDAWSGWLRGHRRAMGFVTVALGRLEAASTGPG